jgi:uncharacterized protein YceH (UPF0502 family)
VTVHRIDAAQARVLGCLLEKQRTTPDQYPLSLNVLRLACNQTTNRDPVLDLDESQVRDALQRLAQIGWARLTSGPGSRAAKYRQLFDEALDLSPAESAVLALLLLRGAQTAAELKTRCERLHHFGSTDDVMETLQRLDVRELVHLMARRPGQREERWTHLLGEETGRDEPDSLERRVARLEEMLAELERSLAERGLLD